MLPLRRSLTISALALASLTLPACVGYHAYPPIPGVNAIEDPNSSTMTTVMVESLRYAARRYRPDGTVVSLNEPLVDGIQSFAVELPEGIDRKTYLSVVERVGRYAQPLTEETRTWPRFIVTRVWIKGDDTKVDVLRPLGQLGTNDAGQYTTEPLTMRLRGGFNPWHVTAHRRWAVGSVASPNPPYMLPGGPITQEEHNDRMRRNGETVPGEELESTAGWGNSGSGGVEDVYPSTPKRAPQPEPEPEPQPDSDPHFATPSEDATE